MTEYSGKENLDFLEAVPNYLNEIERLLLQFIGGANKVLDFGAGSGTYLRRLAAKNIKPDAVELDAEYAAKLGCVRYLADLPHKYERIYTCDVLEHIEDDTAILKQLHDKLEEGGEIFIYVPAFNLLYSAMDKKIGHYRRYTKTMLLKRLKQAGFKIESAEYLDSIGFFGGLFFKYFGDKSGNIDSPAIYNYYKYIFPISLMLDKLGAKYLLGKNLLVIAQK